jgi:hypothetical protein
MPIDLFFREIIQSALPMLYEGPPSVKRFCPKGKMAVRTGVRPHRAWEVHFE